MSSGDHQITVHSRLDQEEDNRLFGELEEKKTQYEEKNSSNGEGQGSNQVTKIQRVHQVMKDVIGKKWKEYFEPKAIAIGLIHADSTKLSVSRDLKYMWAAKYLDGLKQKEILGVIRDEIESLIEKYFDVGCLHKDIMIKARPDEYVYGTIARMLFVDGCAMLQFIYSFVWDDFVKHLKINAAQAILVQQDLFLLENQIPFRVLEIIMGAGKNKQQKEKEEEQKKIKQGCENLTKMETAVQMFIQMSNMSTALPRPEVSWEVDGIVHLLDLLRRSLLDDRDYSARSDDCSNSAPVNCLRSFVNVSVFLIFKLPFYVLRFLVCLALIVFVTFRTIICLLINLLRDRDCQGFKSMCCVLTQLVIYMCMIRVGCFESPKSPITRRSFRNVQELKAAGIELKPSKSRCWKQVSFSSGLFRGGLRLCPILVDKSTEGKLLNMIAYEMCPDYHCKTTKDSKTNDYGISSYLSFLDSLIDNQQDVKDLRAANILRHRLSSDEEVAKLFNNFSHISVADDTYGNVKSEIQEYYEWQIRIWITEFCQEHLSSPWTLLALIAAAVALGLTAAQTYFAINPR